MAMLQNNAVFNAYVAMLRYGLSNGS